MRLGVVSDTHGHVSNTQAAVRVLEPFDPDAVLHCGDIGTAEVIRQFSAWPTHFVLGNCDWDAEGLREAAEAQGKVFHGRFADLEIEGVRIAVLHGDDTRRLRETVDSGDWDLVCCGHTHVAEQRREGRTLLLNPGALYRARTHTVAVVELPDLEVTPLTV